MKIKPVLGDCLIESENIKSGRIDLILTDLPYGTVKDIGNDDSISHGMKGKTEWDSKIPTEKIFEIANRILRKNGKMVLFCQEPFTTELINSALPNLPFLYKMIWKKDHFANSLIAKKAPVNYFEEVLVFGKIHDYEGIHPLRPYFSEILKYTGLKKSEIVKKIGQKADHCFRVDSSQFIPPTEIVYEQLCKEYSLEKMNGFKSFEEIKTMRDPFDSTFNLWEGNKYKSNILEYKKDYEGLHPTQKPVLLLEDIIKTFSNENDYIVDLTMGSGSTLVASKNTNRNCLGIEKNQEYFNIAVERLQ